MSTMTVYGVGGYQPAHPTQGVIELWDGDAGTVTFYNDDGTLKVFPDGDPPNPRPMTADELLEVNGTAEQQNERAIVTNLTQDMAAIQAILDDTNSNINANPAARIKDICRMLRRLGRQTLNDYTGTD